VPTWLVHDEGVQRVSVVGNSGSGETVLAKRLAVVLEVPHIELDAAHHLPGWTPIDPVAFRSELDRLTTKDRWVICSNYCTVVMDGPVWERAGSILSPDPYESIIAWAWTQHAEYEGRLTDAPGYSHLRFVRLRGRREMERWVAGLHSGNEAVAQQSAQATTPRP
jgi:hypothetical protein